MNLFLIHAKWGFQNPSRKALPVDLVKGSAEVILVSNTIDTDLTIRTLCTIPDAAP
jgi:hypothetical protein